MQFCKESSFKDNFEENMDPISKTMTFSGYIKMIVSDSSIFNVSPSFLNEMEAKYYPLKEQPPIFPRPGGESIIKNSTID